MDAKQFQILCGRLSDNRLQIVAAKRPEYTEGKADVFANFKTVAAELKLTPIQVWYVYFRKHIASISQYCSDPTKPLAEPLDGRIADAMNYLELLHGLVHENDSVTIN